MKYLYIIRHAKAEQHVIGKEDHDRNLLNNGRKRALKLSKWLNNISPKIEKFLCSSSYRTIQTAEIINTELLEKVSINIESKLYGASEEEILNYLIFLDDNINSIGLVGHEPGLRKLAIYLTGGYAKGLETVLNKHFSTSSAIVLVFNIKRWDQISERIGILSHYYDSLNT
tara:strand:- start:3011 stop:3523 length:513 start_codon:yes stop_codon:yes gene_type:complete